MTTTDLPTRSARRSLPRAPLNDPGDEGLAPGKQRGLNKTSFSMQGGDSAENLMAEVLSAGLDSDSVFSYGIEGFTPNHTEKCGASDPQENAIDDAGEQEWTSWRVNIEGLQHREGLEALAEEVYFLLRREAYIERERHGAR